MGKRRTDGKPREPEGVGRGRRGIGLLDGRESPAMYIGGNPPLIPQNPVLCPTSHVGLVVPGEDGIDVSDVRRQT